MKNKVFLVFLALLAIACEREDQKVSVQYRVSMAYADTEISYQNDREELITEVHSFESGEDVWTWSGQLIKGDIVYLSARYSDSTSSVKVQILVDGKVYKEGSSNNEPSKYLIVSGTVPFD